LYILEQLSISLQHVGLHPHLRDAQPNCTVYA